MERNEREIKVLLVGENRDTLSALSRQLNTGEVAVAGEAGFGPVAYTWASQLQPDVVVVAMEEPMARAIKTVESLALGKPCWPVVVVSSLGDRESIRKAMRSGADDYVIKPSPPNELHAAIVSLARRVRDMATSDSSGRAPAGRAGTVVSVFGGKGGIGKTMLATNLATSIAMGKKERVALVDLDLQFGDVALVTETPPNSTIVDFVGALDKLDADLVEGFLPKHRTGLRVLPAPINVDDAEAITGEQVRHLLDFLAATYDYVIVDTPNSLAETVLAALDASTLVLLLTTPEVPCIKRTKACLDLMRHWQYSDDKVKLVINKVNGRAEAGAAEIESVLQYPSFWKLPFDRVADSITGQGGLFVQSRPKANISTSISQLSKKVQGVEVARPPLLRWSRLRLAFSRW